ncbi:sigma-54-dependent transcriptional regulator [Dinghuibacter silviterrae]|uniref:Two-component system response regulator HydG n=1 Tax=Dinghuibacter silviterrae TaxID=1539049 RepID=A0A4R8DRI9_9BACT|nr:sigma-54 dependent transcriptional regulator [Dinghuibacter silviterrae]TDX00820.1 two-component system response regulator HydG [Dinghuibacter silviterrae]
MPKTLLVEDDPTFSRLLGDFLHKHAYQTDIVRDVKTGIRRLETDSYDLLLLDYRLPDGNGLEVLSRARENGVTIPAIVMTSFDDIRTAVRAIRSGAFDYITKPVNPDELLMVIHSAMDTGKPVSGRGPEPDYIRGGSAPAAKLYEYIDLVAPTDMSVIIQGESGTGKEYAARCIHRGSKRASGPFVAIDCGVLSRDLASSELFGHIKGAFTGAVSDKKGLFETAKGGTLFLDEIGNLGYDTQVKLLRALQEKIIQPIGSTRPIPVDVRMIVASNEDLPTGVQKGEFRQDLYHRLNEFKIHVPPLRERGKDIDLFITHFIQQSNEQLGKHVHGIDPEALDLLHRYDWPGNLRELRNVVKRMVLLAKTGVAGIDCLPDDMELSVTWTPGGGAPGGRGPLVLGAGVPGSPSAAAPGSAAGTDLKALQEANEKALIEKTLRDVRYNKSKAARLLNIDRKTLYSKIERYGLS